MVADPAQQCQPEGPLAVLDASVAHREGPVLSQLPPSLHGVAGWLLKRQASRVVLLSRDERVFLIRSIDPADASKPAWLEIPGGGIDPGESSSDCAARELREEAGITKVEIGPVVWTQYVEFSFGGYDFEQDEVIHVAWTDQTELAEPQGLEFLEALAFQGAKWWTRSEVEASTEPFLPPRLPELIGQLFDGDLPDPPIDISPG